MAITLITADRHNMVDIASLWTTRGVDPKKRRRFDKLSKPNARSLGRPGLSKLPYEAMFSAAQDAPR